MVLWGTIFGEAIPPDTPVLVHELKPCVYSCMLPDLGITLEHRPLPGLVAWWLAKHLSIATRDAAGETWRYRPRASVVFADSLARWASLSADHKIWMFERFKVNLDAARAAAEEFQKTQERMINGLVEHKRKA